MIAGHTKFSPDRLFSQVVNSYNRKDVFTISELEELCSLHASTRIEDGTLVLKWWRGWNILICLAQISWLLCPKLTTPQLSWRLGRSAVVEISPPHHSSKCCWSYGHLHLISTTLCKWKNGAHDNDVQSFHTTRTATNILTCLFPCSHLVYWLLSQISHLVGWVPNQLSLLHQGVGEGSLALMMQRRRPQEPF